MVRHGLAITLLSILALSLSVGCASSPYGDFSGVPDRQSCTVELSLPNMACEEACPLKVRGALYQVRGVRDVAVDYRSRTAVVEAVYPACSADGFEAMAATLWSRGYKSRVVRSHTGTAGDYGQFR